MFEDFGTKKTFDMCNYWTWSIFDHLKMVKSECLEILGLRHEKWKTHFRGISQGWLLHEGNLHIYHISAALGNLRSANACKEVARIWNSHWGLYKPGELHAVRGDIFCLGKNTDVLFFLFSWDANLRTWVYFFGGDGWMARSKSIDSRFGFRWLQHWG